jgi:hypothetical protein
VSRLRETDEGDRRDRALLTAVSFAPLDQSSFDSK